MQMEGPAINPTVLIGGAIILVIVVIIIGYRNRAVGRRYWVISTFKIITVFAVWQVLSFPIWGIIMTHTGDLIEQRIFNINVVNTLVYLGMTLLLVLSEMRRNQPRPDLA